MRTAFKAGTLTAGAIVAALLVAGFATTGRTVDGAPVAATNDLSGLAHSSSSELTEARSDCDTGYASLGELTEEHDGEVTLVIDGAGAGPDPEGEITGVFCVLTAIDAPASVTARMQNTRALDGMQDASWDNYKATWSFHPDNGFDLIITES